MSEIENDRVRSAYNDLVRVLAEHKVIIASDVQCSLTIQLPGSSASIWLPHTNPTPPTEDGQ